MATHTQEGSQPAEAAGSGGLPQFDFQWWPGQIIWFLAIFLVVLLFVRLFAAPRVGGGIDDRDAKIAGDIADARRMKDEAEAQAALAAAETAQARASAQRLAQDARTKAQAEVSARLAEEEAKLAEQAGVAEARISKARDAAMANVASIASETAGLIVSKLTGRAATTAELTAAKGA